MKFVDSVSNLRAISEIERYYYRRKVMRSWLTAKEIENIISYMSKYEILKEN